MGGMRDGSLDWTNVVRQRRWRVRHTIAEPHHDDEEDPAGDETGLGCARDLEPDGLQHRRDDERADRSDRERVEAREHAAERRPGLGPRTRAAEQCRSDGDALRAAAPIAP